MANRSAKYYWLNIHVKVCGVSPFKRLKWMAPLQKASGHQMVSAFIPTTPNPTSGFLIMVPKDKAQELDMSVEEAFKMVVSLGTLKAET